MSDESHPPLPAPQPEDPQADFGLQRIFTEVSRRVFGAVNERFVVTGGPGKVEMTTFGADGTQRTLHQQQLDSGVLDVRYTEHPRCSKAQRLDALVKLDGGPHLSAQQHSLRSGVALSTAYRDLRELRRR